MARKKTVTTIEADTSEDHEIDPTIAAGDAQESDPIQELIDLGGDDGVTYTVHKLSGKVGEPGGYCAKYGSAELSLDAIRDTFGGGRYKITARDSRGQFVSARNLYVMDVPKGSTTLMPQAAPAQQNVAELITALNSSKGDSNAMMLQMIKSQSDMLTAILSKPAPVAPAGPSAMELIAMIKALQPEKNDSDPVKLLLQGLELGQKLGGGEDNSLMGLAGKGLEMLGPLIANAPPAQAPGRAAPRSEAPAPRLTGQPIANPNPNPQPTNEDPMLRQVMWLRQQVGALLTQAARGRDPAVYAVVMLDNLPAFVTPEEIFTRLSDATCIDQLATLDARVNQYRPWFEEFRTAILEQFSDEGDDAAQPADFTPIAPDLTE